MKLNEMQGPKCNKQWFTDGTDASRWITVCQFLQVVLPHSSSTRDSPPIAHLCCTLFPQVAAACVNCFSSELPSSSQQAHAEHSSDPLEKVSEREGPVPTSHLLCGGVFLVGPYAVLETSRSSVLCGATWPGLCCKPCAALTHAQMLQDSANQSRQQ